MITATKTQSSGEVVVPRRTKKRNQPEDTVIAKAGPIEKLVQTKAVPVGAVQSTENDDTEKDSEEAKLVHESLKAGRSRKAGVPSSSKRYTPPDETAADRDRRTVFFGNLPIEVAKSQVSQVVSLIFAES